MQDQMTQAGYTAESFWGLYDSIGGTIGAQEDLIDQIDITLDWLSDLDGYLDGVKDSADAAAQSIGNLGSVQAQYSGGSYGGNEIKGGGTTGRYTIKGEYDSFYLLSNGKVYAAKDVKKADDGNYNLVSGATAYKLWMRKDSKDKYLTPM
jgi:hypothetical protein